MRNILFTLGAATNMYLSGTAVASAQSYRDYLCRRYGIYCHDGGGATNVPEIDVSSGLLAVAAVVAMLLLAWELRRRRA